MFDAFGHFYVERSMVSDCCCEGETGRTGEHSEFVMCTDSPRVYEDKVSVREFN